jgi:hypothetical protein
MILKMMIRRSIQWRWITILDFENDDRAIDPMAMDYNP